MTTYDPIQTRFKDVIRDFENKLNNDKLFDEIRNFRSAEDVYEATDKLQMEQGRTGHLRHLSKIGPFLERMQDYSEAIKTFVQVKPDILALIWGPMRLLLQWTSVLKQSFDAIINTTAEIGELLPEFLEVTKLFGENAQLKDVLVLFFQDILDFYLVALQFFSRSKWKYVFEALWPRQRDRIKLIVTHVSRHALLMRNEVRLEHIREEHKARLEALAHFEKSERANIRQEHDMIRNAVSPRSYDDKLNWYHGRVCVGTNQWLMSEPNFIKWLDHNDDTTRLLWLKGIPGSGKTFLAGAVIDKAKSLGPTMFAFLSHMHTSNTSALSILHSLIFQLTLYDMDLQAILCQTTRENMGSSSDVAESVLSTLLSSLSTAYIVIDGLDEIDKIERGRLLNHMIAISKSCIKVRILISSRIESDIFTKIDSCFFGIQVNDHNTSSIQVFVTKKTFDFLASRDFLQEEKAEIETLLAPIAASAKGMFLYAKILLDCIELLPDVDSIKAELRVLPKDLHDAYRRILLRIQGLRSAVARQNARQILGWIGCSPTPLTILEIEQALTVQPSYDGIVAPVKSSLNLVELCGPIVEVENGYARFVHFTVKEYIFDQDIEGYIDIDDATLDLTNRCIYYLCKEHFEEWLTPDEVEQHLLLGSYRLHCYAVTYWFELVKQIVTRQDSNTPPPSLITALEVLTSMRARYDFTEYPISSDQVKGPELDCFEQHNTSVAQMLRHVARYNQKLLGSAVHLNEIEDWKWPAPFMSVRISKQIHRILNDMLCRHVNHVENCRCAVIRHHYGPDVFKCGYLDCPNFRSGFCNVRSRESHEKLHTKPWKCNEPTCEYAEVGFVSQRMRDTHAASHRQVQGSCADLSSSLSQDDDFEALVIDLIQQDKFSDVVMLVPRVKDLHSHARKKIMEAAVDHGSAAILNILLQPQIVDSDIVFYLGTRAIEKGNNEAWQILKPQVRPLHNSSQYRGLLMALIVSESLEARRECENFLLDRSLHARNSRLNYEQNVTVGACHSRVVERTCGLKDRELRLISFWTKLSTRSVQFTTSRSFKQLLARVAQIPSILLAKVVLKHGVTVDYRHSSTYLTPLHHVARRNSQQNAKMIEFLLYHGADHEAKASLAQLKISEEKGAKGIAKWLNMSWEELVKKVKADRARGYCPPEYRLDSEDLQEAMQIASN